MPGEDYQSWSVTAANNGNSDTSINWAEGQPRASVNNSARSMMAAHAKDRNLRNGSILTGGTANAQTFSSGVSYTTAPTGLRVTLKIGPGLTNTAAATLEMDGLGAVAVKDLRGSDPAAGAMTADSYADFLYNGTNWILLDVPAVYRSGDTMTGTLTVPSLISTGAISATTVTASSDITAAGIMKPASEIIFTGVSDKNITFLTSSDWRLNWAVADGALRYYAAGVSVMSLRAGGLFDITGQGYKPGGGLWGDNSDARIKNVLGEFGLGLDAIRQLRPVCYNFKGNDTTQAPASGETAPYKNSRHYQAAKDGQQFIGLLAQDTEAVAPALVTRAAAYIDGSAVGDMRSINTDGLVYALINCVKELAARVEVLERKA